MFTDEQLLRIMLNAGKRKHLFPHLRKAMENQKIDTYLRQAAFLAQIAHESMELRFMEEIWGPTAAQRRYEPPSTLASRLGNTKKGDGFRYKGRGPIQLTGRSNYANFGKLLNVDFVAQPELAATPEWGFRVAALFWQRRGCNELADRPDFIAVTKTINGGTNGLTDRQKYYARAKMILDKDVHARAAEESIPLRILVNDKPVIDAAPFWEEEHIHVALRPVAEAAGWRIDAVAKGSAVVVAGGVAHSAPLEIRHGSGYVALRDLTWASPHWDGATRTASLTFPRK